jgi:folate-binding protein YgfZ
VQSQVHLSGYAEAVERAAYYVQPQSGYLRVTGEDRVTFLQRQTTNDVNLLAPGRVITTVLTTPAARITDVLTLFEENSTIGVLTLPGKGQETFQYLRSRIFFMDKVSIEDASREYSLVELVGPQAEDILVNLGNSRHPGGDGLLSIDRENLHCRVWLNRNLGYRLLLPMRQLDALTGILEEFETAQLAAETFDVLRIEAGIPAKGHELIEEYTPLETGLGGSVSAAKGCYTGQEVIARQITYDKVTRQLVGLKLEAAAAVGETLSRVDNGQAVGKITSAAVSPRCGQIALAVVRRPSDEPGTRLLVGEESGGRSASVVRLPFVS